MFHTASREAEIRALKSRACYTKNNGRFLFVVWTWLERGMGAPLIAPRRVPPPQGREPRAHSLSRQSGAAGPGLTGRLPVRARSSSASPDDSHRLPANTVHSLHSLAGPQQILQNQGIDSKSENRNGCMDAFLASKSAGCLFSGHRRYPAPPAPIDGSKSFFFGGLKTRHSLF